MASPAPRPLPARAHLCGLTARRDRCSKHNFEGGENYKGFKRDVPENGMVGRPGCLLPCRAFCRVWQLLPRNARALYLAAAATQCMHYTCSCCPTMLMVESPALGSRCSRCSSAPALTVAAGRNCTLSRACSPLQDDITSQPGAGGQSARGAARGQARAGEKQYVKSITGDAREEEMNSNIGYV